MTTKLFARGIGGALAIASALGIVGCSGYDDPQGAAGEGEIGVTSQAIGSGATDADRDLANALSATGGTPVTTPLGLKGAASCIVNHGGTEKMIMVGGQDSSPAFSNRAYLFDPTAVGGDGQWREAGTVTTPRAFGKAIQNPVDNTQCIFVGGLNSGGLVTDVDIYDVDTNMWTNQTAGMQLDAARARFALVPCGTTHLLAIGGGDGATRESSIEIWSSANGFVDTTKDLTDARYDFGIASYSDHKRFVVTGGNGNLSGNFSSRVDAIVATLDQNGECTGVTTVANLADAALNNSDKFALDEPRRGNLVVPTHVTPSASAEEFLVIAGDSASALSARYEVFTVDWTASPLQVVAVPSTPAPLVSTLTNPPTLASKPVLVKMGSSLAFVGGESHAGAPIANTLAEYVPTNGAFNNFDATTPADLAVDRVEHVAEFLNGSFLWTSTGRDNGGTLLLSTEKISP